jgi:hypothetical protein
VKTFALSSLLGLLGLVVQAAAAAINPFDGGLAEPGASSNALTVVVDGRPTTLTLAEIESLPLHTTTLVTPFGERGEFIGVLLTDLLDRVDPGATEQVRLVAMDGHTVVLTRAQIQADVPLLATRLDGEPLTADSKGPFRLLFPTLTDQTRAGAFPATHWIWNLVEIHRID